MPPVMVALPFASSPSPPASTHSVPPLMESVPVEAAKLSNPLSASVPPAAFTPSSEAVISISPPSMERWVASSPS